MSSIQAAIGHAAGKADRTAPWLLNSYYDTRWKVKDTYGVKTATVNFEILMADGCCLTEHESLYATVKEYAFWCRDEAYTAIDDAATHVQHVRTLMSVAHALSVRKIWSFAKMGVLDLNEIAEACRWGTDALIEGSSRLIAFLKTQLDPLVPWPRSKGKVDRTWVLKGAGLPHTVFHTDQVARVLSYADRFAISTSTNFDPQVDEPNGITAQALNRFVAPLEHIHAMRRVMRADSIRFKPFPEGASAFANQFGAVSKRTPTPVPRLALKLIGRSMEWIAENGDRIVAALRAETPWVSVMVQDHRGERRSSRLLRAIQLLATACYTVLATFSARRVSEHDDLTRDCLKGGPGGWWLHCPIVKTHNRKELIPIPDIAAKAVQMLLRLSDGNDNDPLFRHSIKVGRQQVETLRQLKPSSHLNWLAEEMGAQFDPTKEGVRWNWTSHQFRRFFAILYFHRYENGDLESLSHHLRHFNLNMTRRYVTSDPESAAIFMSYEWGYTGRLARSIASGTRVPRSGMDKDLANLAKRIADNFRKNLQVVTPERVGATMALVMRRQGVVIVPFPWSDCCAPSTGRGARHANCRSGSTEPCVGADLSRSAPEVCPGCRWSSMNDEQAFYVDDAMQSEFVESHEPTREGTMLSMFEEERLVLARAIRQRVKSAVPQQEVTE